MVHIMRLKPKYFNFILNGTKRIEIRLNDEKRQKIKVGDRIKFIKDPDVGESFTVNVVDLLKYDSFFDMINDLDISLLADKLMTKDELLTCLEGIYSKEDECKYGVLAIKIAL